MLLLSGRANISRVISWDVGERAHSFLLSSSFSYGSLAQLCFTESADRFILIYRIRRKILDNSNVQAINRSILRNHSESPALISMRALGEDMLI